MGRRLLFLVDTLGLGGTPKHFVELLPHLQQRGFDISLWNMGRIDRYYNILLDEGIRVINRRRRRLPLELALYLKRNPDTIVHSYLYASHVADAVVAHLMNAIYIKSTRNSGHWRRNTWTEGIKIRLRTTLVKHHIVNSEIAKHYLVSEEHVPEDRIAVIPNGIEDKIDAWPQISRSELGLAPDDFVMVVVNRLKRGKNVEFIIEKTGRLCKILPSLRLLMVGYGPEKGKLMAQAEELGIGDRCLFLGYQEYPYCFMRVGDVFVSASTSEGMSNSLLEAMMIGLPAVVHEEANAGVVIHGETGLLFNASDPGSCEFEKHITCLYEDRKVARRMGRAARERYLERYTIDKQVERYIKFYDCLGQ